MRPIGKVMLGFLQTQLGHSHLPKHGGLTVQPHLGKLMKAELRTHKAEQKD